MIGPQNVFCASPFDVVHVELYRYTIPNSIYLYLRLYLFLFILLQPVLKLATK